jgi:hypothetical protein
MAGRGALVLAAKGSSFLSMRDNVVVLRTQTAEYLGTDQADIDLRDDMLRMAAALFDDSKSQQLLGLIDLSKNEHDMATAMLASATRMTAEFIRVDTLLRGRASLRLA